jgi:hypothetical protein
MLSLVSPTSPTTPSSTPSAVSREEIARRVAARTRQRRILLPDTEEWVEARREPMKRMVVNIRAKFEGPKVRRAAGRLRLGRRTDTCWQAKGVLEVLPSYLPWSGSVTHVLEEAEYSHIQRSQAV